MFELINQFKLLWFKLFEMVVSLRILYGFFSFFDSTCAQTDTFALWTRFCCPVCHMLHPRSISYSWATTKLSFPMFQNWTRMIVLSTDNSKPFPSTQETTLGFSSHSKRVWRPLSCWGRRHRRSTVVFAVERTAILVQFWNIAKLSFVVIHEYEFECGWSTWHTRHQKRVQRAQVPVCAQVTVEKWEESIKNSQRYNHFK